ncbi:O-antigen polymerase [Paenibacillus sp. NPDC057934]|uniref:O-antigen polymerase n=1 Tax=Paenibacillus sp. NPDC057934 TaxID=3346282 RepID=UPI0036DB0746
MEILFVFLYIMMIFLSLLISKFKYQKLLLPNTVFTILWGIVGFLSIVGDVGALRPSATIHVYAILTIATFNITYFIFTKKAHLTPNINYKSTILYEINNKAVYLIEIIALILISPNLVASLKAILANGLDLTYVRTQTYILQRFDSQILMFLFRAVPLTLFSVVMLLAIYNLVNGKKRFLNLVVFNLLIEILTFGGRGKLWNFVAFFIGALILTDSFKKIKIKGNKYLIYAVTAMVIVTILRGEDLLNVIKAAYLYFVGPFSYLELIIRDPLRFGLEEPAMYGYLTLGFLFEPIVLTLKALLGLQIDVPSYHFNIYAQPFVNIGDAKIVFYNNNTTMLYTFLRDFGPSGVIIGTSFLAWLICFFQKKAIQKNNLRYKIISIFMYSIILDSVRLYMLTNTTLVIIFITLMFAIKKQRNQNTDIIDGVYIGKMK